jgi:hypothetical protein
MRTLLSSAIWIFAVMFFLTVGICHAPGATDHEGLLFGLFRIDPIDDVNHLLFGIAAVLAARHSRQYEVYYFRALGILYGTDVVLGLAQGAGMFSTRVNLALNAPHVVISSFAILLGFILHRQLLALGSRRPSAEALLRVLFWTGIALAVVLFLKLWIYGG